MDQELFETFKREIAASRVLHAVLERVLSVDEEEDSQEDQGPAGPLVVPEPKVGFGF